VYVPTFEVPVGPVVLLQVIPETPAIIQLAVPVGVTPDGGPVTVAVNVNTDPKEAVGELVVTATVGLNLETTRL
jgi:hypothetical protein